MSKRTVIICAGLLLGLTLAGASQAASCKPNFIQGSNGALLTGHDKSLAIENAISVWEVRAIASAGPNWKKWPKSTERTTQCFQKKFKRWKCTVRARPCQG